MGKREKNPKAVGAGRMLAWQSRAISQGLSLIHIWLNGVERLTDWQCAEMREREEK